MLLVVGDLVEEILIDLQRDPERGSDMAVRTLRVRGGSAANVAAIDAEIGGEPRFVGQTGADTIGKALASDLGSRGVDTRIHHEGRTGAIVTTVGRGGRTRLIDRGTSSRLTTIPLDALDGVDQIHLPAASFTLDPLATALEQFLAAVRDRRIPVVLGGPGPLDIELMGSEPYLQLVATIAPDAVVLSRRSRAGLGSSTRAPLRGAGTTVVTAGSRPTLVIAADGAVQSVPVPPVDRVRDRTGAGEGFLAGFMSARRAGAAPVAATHAGHSAAAEVLVRLGPTTVG